MPTPLDTTTLLQTLAEVLDETLKEVAPGTHFSLLVWQQGGVNYVSNADRESCRKAMREVLERWDTPGYKRQ
jgi:hypothetical protein